MMCLTRVWKGLLCACLLGGIIAAAQSRKNGSLAGRLTDWYSTPLDGATVIARNQSTGAETRTTTARNGAYRFTSLGPGEYVLEAEIPQLGHGHVDGIFVAAGHEARVQAALQFTLPLRSPIQAAFHDIDPVAPVLTTTLPAEQLQALPLIGRRWQDFVLDKPTAGRGTSASNPGGQDRMPSAEEVDGASVTMGFHGPDSTLRGVAPISEAAIQEVEAATGNRAAEAGSGSQGAVSITTRRGTNGLHGQGLLFDRQNLWGAQNPFTRWVKETAPATSSSIPVFTAEPYTPPDREMTWGFGLGRQIKRDKLYWFAAFDGSQRNDPGMAMVKHPESFFAQPADDQMQVLSARLGLSNADPAGEGLAVYSPMLETLAGLLGPSPRTAAHWGAFGRIDWRAAERHRITLEASTAQSSAPGGALTGVSEHFGNRSFGTETGSSAWALGRWEAFVTPNLLATTQFSWGHDRIEKRGETPSTFEQALNHNIWGQLPQIVVDSRNGFTIGNPARFGAGSYPDEQRMGGQESWDWIRGGLLLKGGFEMNHIADATALLLNKTGTYSYASVENFVSDALTFASFGINGSLDPFNQHNCDQTGRVWRDAKSQLHGLGYLPCYAYYTQTMGPSNWRLSTNDFAGFITAQWQPARRLTLSTAVRWEHEQLPGPIAALVNPLIPGTARMPSLGSSWGPRMSLALGSAESRWPLLRLGYGMYFGRTENATVATALTQTGSFNGDLSFFLRPTDNLYGGGAPPFPYVFAGEPFNVVKPGAVEFAPSFRNPEVHQAVAALEETLPDQIHLTASAVASLGRRLPISIDTNFDPSANPGAITYGIVDELHQGPIKAARMTVPFYASWPSAASETGFAGRLNPSYQQITSIASRANSTYEAAMLAISRNGRRGLSFNTRYTYGHAMDWNSNETTSVAGSDVLDPANFQQEYGTSNLDVRHSASGSLTWRSPWKLHHALGIIANGWMASSIGQFRGGLPYTMRTGGSLAREFDARTREAIVALGPGMNGSGGDNRVYGVGRNTFRYPSTWKADLRLGKSFDLGHLRELDLLAESFNLFNHQNVTRIETTGYTIDSGSIDGGLPTLTFMTGLKTNTTEFGRPLGINGTNVYRERKFQFGMRMRF